MSEEINTAPTEPTANTETISEPAVEPAPVEPQKFKLKVDGQEVEATLEDLQKAYSKVSAADKRFQEGAKARAQAEEFVRLLQTNPLKVLTHPSLGLNFRELAENYLVEQLQEAQLTPEQKELRDAKAQLQAIKEAEEMSKKEAEEQQRAQLEEHYSNEYTNQIVQALETATLPKTPATVKRMAYYMSQALQKGLDLKASDVVELVKQDYIQEQKELFGGLDGDMLLKLLGEDTASKIRKSDLARLKKSQPAVSKPSVSSPSPKKEEQKLSKEEWRKRLEEKIR